MSYFPSKAYEVRYVTESSFCAEIAAPSTYWDDKSRVKAVCDPGGLKHSTIDDIGTLVRTHDRLGVISTIKSESTLKLSMFLAGKPASPTDSALKEFFEQALGGSHTATATTVSVGNTALSFTVADASGLLEGDIVRVGAKGDGRGGGQCREIATIAGAVVTLDFALPGIPASPDAIAVGTTLYPDEQALADIGDGSYKSMALLLRKLAAGGGAATNWECRGCRGPFTLSDLGPGKAAKIDFNFMVAAWSILAADPAPPAAALAADAPVVVRYCSVIASPTSGTGYTAPIHVADMSLDPGLKFQALPSPSGEQAVAGFICAESDSKITLRPYLDASTWQTALTSQTTYRLLCELGYEATKSAVIYAPYARLDAQPGIGEAAGVHTTDLSFRLAENNSGTTDLELSHFRIALL